MLQRLPFPIRRNRKFLLRRAFSGGGVRPSQSPPKRAFCNLCLCASYRALLLAVTPAFNFWVFFALVGSGSSSVCVRLSLQQSCWKADFSVSPSSEACTATTNDLLLGIDQL
jgi:hypothetical protein